jgi:diaminopropionate ammonia-lyase
MQTYVQNSRDLSWQCPGPSPDAVKFHRSLDGYKPTDLVELPELASELGVGHVLAKNESGRLGLPAFKALGASWAIHSALQREDAHSQFTIVTATDGNHGRAVAKFAKLFGHKAKIVVPPGVHPTAVQAIVDEGAEVSRVDGTYDDAVAQAARIAEEPGHILVQDTAWDGYEVVPSWIVEGYATMFAEIDQQIRDKSLNQADLVLVPAGVGSLLQGALAHYRSKPELLATKVVSVEPTSAACVLESISQGAPASVPTTTTVMAGLNCGTISTLAWPYVEKGLDGAIAITDDEDIRAAKDLAQLSVAAGPCGAAGLAALRKHRNELGLGPSSAVVILITEGSEANPVPD